MSDQNAYSQLPLVRLYAGPTDGTAVAIDDIPEGNDVYLSINQEAGLAEVHLFPQGADVAADPFGLTAWVLQSAAGNTPVPFQWGPFNGFKGWRVAGVGGAGFTATLQVVISPRGNR